MLLLGLPVLVRCVLGNVKAVAPSYIGKSRTARNIIVS